MCSTTTLRTINIGFATACVYLMYRIHAQLHGASEALDGDSAFRHSAAAGAQQPSATSLWTAVAISLLPTHFFFGFLYYTDVGSVAAVLWTYLLVLTRQNRVAALAGALAVSFRQTNAVWVAFITAVGILRDVEESLSRPGSGSVPGPRTNARTSTLRQGDFKSHAIDGRRRESALPSQGHTLEAGRTSGVFQSQPFVSALCQAVAEAWRLRGPLLQQYGPLLLVPLAFVGFVVVNKGVTLGDKAAHKPVQHWMQLAYFALFACGALAPVTLRPRAILTSCGAVKRQLQQQPLWTIVTALLSVAALTVGVHRFTLVHPYLVADNRHYTFYIWRKLLNRHHAVRYMLIPVYVYCFWVLQRLLRSAQNSLWTAGYWICTAITLVPAWLIELRYFTIPFIILSLNMRPPGIGDLRLLASSFLLVNAFTLYVFVTRDFQWPDGSIARFMW